MLADLRVPWLPSRAYCPWEKGFVERMNRTISHGALPFLEAFIGHDPLQQQAIRDRFTMAQRRGKTEMELLCATLNADDLRRFLGQWLRTIYGERPHSGLTGAFKGKTPNQMHREWTGEIRRVDPRALDLLMAPAPGGETRKVLKNGISIEGAYYHCAEFAGWEGKEVLVFYLPSDMGRVTVFSLDYQPIGVAICPERAGIDPREIAPFIQIEQARVKARTRKEYAAARRIKPHQMLQKLMDQREMSALPAPDQSRQIVHYQTPELDARAEMAAMIDADARAARAEIPTSIDTDDAQIRMPFCADAVAESLDVSDDDLWALFQWTEGRANEPEVAKWREAFHATPLCRTELQEEKDFGPRWSRAEIEALAKSALPKLQRRWKQDEGSDRSSQ